MSKNIQSKASKTMNISFYVTFISLKCDNVANNKYYNLRILL